ncbi:DUF6320 domain-containing protein [bacterium 210820-DFI.6.52]|uniref:Uncharacterized protein n=1 Tax=Bittarella massiliensis (ex Durand et al. 2017) TaxID=1720313 RepID=A0AAQ1MBX2_9FIRM|nr:MULTISPECIES: DUF6320 domain-containing protein [Eubacteriales]MCB5940830.1 DUF6320 domain-containing protein [bacterium 210820-DFI.6.52]ERI98149.1 hypothetical protein HMPREF0262_03056 [Clostridium sp. ATCC 29733]MZL69594.1 hypothetical protein [Bittarella massiliensis (ex Durand et al. 2017)]MZL80511.1 hypothetical protein [Bittarella massiliensis (ex Durand et al. 2017)]SHF79307.1 hypothetical protein SAMN05444424_0697 [Bittarella massiliensis (ex Durand et al. 2017)]
MKYCEQCKLTVTGQRSRCPLCQSVLRDEGEPYEEVFPVIPTVYNRFQFFFKLLIFASAVLGIVSVVINLLLPQSGVWSLFVLGGIGCLWVFLFIAVRKRNNIPKNILWQVAVAILFCLLWDLFTGWHGWSVDYVVPSICVAAMAALAVTAKVFRLVVGDFLFYLLISVLFGILPVISILLGWVQVLYPSLICVGCSLVSLAAVLIFQGENMKREWRRRMHL